MWCAFPLTSSGSKVECEGPSGGCKGEIAVPTFLGAVRKDPATHKHTRARRGDSLLVVLVFLYTVASLKGESYHLGEIT